MAPVRTKAQASTVATSAGGAAVPASEVSLLINEMMTHVHRRSAGDTLAIMNQGGLTMAQLVALHVLAHRGALSVTRVATLLRLSPAATSHLIDRLFGARLVVRTEDPIDRRHKRIEITSTGRDLIEGTNDRRAREFTRVLSSLTGEVQAQFARVLARVVTELKGLPDRDEVREIVGKELLKREAQAGELKQNRTNRRS